MDLLGRLTIAFGVDMTDLDAAGSRLKQVGSEFTQLGAIVTAGVTIPIAAMGLAAGKSAIEFETAMVKIAKTVDAPAPAIRALGEELKDLSEATGTSVIELARVGEIAGQMGIAAGDIGEFTEIITALGVATELSTEAAAEGLAKFSNVMGTSIDDVDRLGSALVALGNAGSSSEAQILEMAQRVTAAGNQVGLAESEVLAFSSALSDLGIDAEAGGTAISKLFLNMQADVATGGGALQQFANVAGLSVRDFSDLFRRDAAGAVVAFVEGLGAMDKSSGEAIVALDEMGIKEVRLRNAVLSLAAGHDVLTDALVTGATGWEENTALMAEAEKFYASTGQELQGLKNKAVNVAGELGTALLPAFNALIDVGGRFLDFARNVVDAFARLPAPVQAGAVAFLGALAAIGPLLVAGGALLTLWGLMAAAALVLGTTVGTIAAAFVGIPAAIALVITAGVAIVKNWDTIKTSAARLIDSVGGIGTGFSSMLTGVKRAGTAIADFAVTVGGALIAVGKAFLGAANQADFLLPPLKRIGTGILDMVGIVGRAVTAFANLVKSLLNFGLAVGELALAIVTPIVQFLQPALEGIAKIFGTVFGAVAAVVTRALEGVVEIVVGIVKRILSALGPLASLADFVAGGLDKLTGLFRDAADTIVGHSIVPDMVEDVGKEFRRLEPLMVGPTRTATTGVTGEFSKLNAGRPAAALVASVGADFGKLPAVMVAPAKEAVAEVTSTFSLAPPLTLKTDGITDVFQAAATRARTISVGLVGGIAEDFAGLGRKMVEPAQHAAAAVTEAFATITSPSKINNIDFKVSIDPTQLYAAVIAAGQTTSQKLQLIQAASVGLSGALQNQIDAAVNEHQVRVAHTEALEAATERQRILSIIVGDETIARREGVAAILDSNTRHSALARTLALAEQSTQHLSEAHFRSATLTERAWSAAGDVLKGAGDNVRGAFDTLKSGVGELLGKFTPMGIAAEVVARLFDKLGPAIAPFMAIVEIVADVLAKALVPVLRILFPIIKLMAQAFTFVGEVVYRVAQGFLLVIGNVVRTIGKLIDALPFVSGKGIIAAGEALLNQADAMGDAARAMRDARDALSDLEFPSGVEEPPDADKGIGKALEEVLTGVTDGSAAQVGATEDVTEAVTENTAVTAAGTVAIREEAGILTSLRDVTKAGFLSVVDALAGFQVPQPVLNVVVDDVTGGVTVTVPPAPAAELDLEPLTVSLSVISGQIAELHPLVTRNTAATEQVAATSQIEADTLALQLAVQLEIRDAIRAQTEVLAAKEFSPTIVVQAGGGGGSSDVPTERGTDGTDRDLADNFDRQGRYDGDDLF